MTPIDNKKLLDYLAGKLSAEEQHEVERWMQENPFEAEAMEGLQQQNHAQLSATVHQLNHQLRKQLQQRKQKRRKKLDNSHQWLYIVIFLVLLIAIVSYLVLMTRK